MIARQEFFPLARSFVWALAVHVLMALLVILGTMNWTPFRQPQPTGMTIEAVIVDTSAIREKREEAQKAAKAAERRKLAEDRRAEQLEQQKQREQQAEAERLNEIERQKQEAQKKRAAEEDARKKREAADRLATLRMEREKKLEEERLKQQQELEKVRQEAAAAERKRQLEAERLKQLEAREKADAAEQQRRAEEAAKQQQQQAEAQEFRAGQEATLSDNYKAAIQQQVTQNWLRPPTAQTGLRCTLKIVQIPGGEVISASISGACNGDEATRRSIVAAVERAGTLPYRGFEKAFQREIDFIFVYDGD